MDCQANCSEQIQEHCDAFLTHTCGVYSSFNNAVCIGYVARWLKSPEARNHISKHYKEMVKPPPEEVKDGQMAVAVSGCLCMVGSLVIIVSFYATSWGAWRVTNPKTASRREKVKALAEGFLLQLFWLSVANFFQGMFFVLSLAIPRNFDIDAICTIQTIGRTYFPLAAAVWNLVLSIELCRFVFRHETDLSGSFERARYKWYHAIGWFSPIPCVAALFIAMNIMNEGIWCWVGILSVNGISPLPQMVLWFVVMILNVCVVVAVRNTLLADSNGKSRESAKQAKKFILTLMAYTTTFLVAFLAILIHEMGIGYVHNGPVYGRPKIRYAAAITAPAQGFLNAIIFVLTNSRAREWLFCSTSSRKSSVEEEALGSYREFSEASNAYSSETLVASEASFLSEPRFDENELTEAVMLDDFYRRTSECSVDSTL
eukprot:gb/GECG01013460.1/.p1 GENE.gb/GECG01013460.1/~~gb/GECG01013460.1/.p1  ORF type:complete len:429 (+),score=31.21 gb/GECG01013460.1/:1-1287(+)